MLDPDALDPSNIVAIVGSITGSNDVLELSENRRYALARVPADGLIGSGKTKMALPKGLQPPIYIYQFGTDMFSPGGWIYGSSDDTDHCDVQIAEDNRTGISRRHLKLDLDPCSHRPRITNLSGNAITVQPSVEEQHLSLQRNDSMEIDEKVIVRLTDREMYFCRPKHPPSCVRGYRQKAERYSADFLDALPKPTTSGTSTAIVRYGHNDTIYVYRGGQQSSGSSASVMMVHEWKSQKIFAAKIPHHKTQDAAVTARNRWESTVKEFRHMMSLRHPCIVEVMDVLVGSTALEPPWMIMEWIPETLRSSRPSADKAQSVFNAVTSGLAYMHSHGYSHRDLKPENILITKGGAKITDFGAAKDRVSNMRTWIGTSIYMAHEFWQPDTPYTQAVDCWSLGVILIEWVNGDSAQIEGWDQISAPTRDEHRRWVVKTLWPCIDEAQGHLKALLRGLIKFEIGNRWTAAECEGWLNHYDIVSGELLPVEPASLPQC